MKNDQEQEEFSFSKVRISKIDTSFDLPKKKEETNKVEEKAIVKEDQIIKEEPIINEEKTIKEDIKKDITPKKQLSLSDTILLKLSDIKNGLLKDKNKKETEKSIYHTVAINLNNIIKNNNSLNNNKRVKVISIKPINKIKKKYSLLPNLIIGNNIKVNVEDATYGKYVLKLNKIAINNINKQINMRVKETRLGKQDKKPIQIDKVHINKTGYNQYQEKLNKFAVDKLYYKLAPKESKRYKLYKFCLGFSICIFLFTSIIIGNWFRQGYSIKKIEKDLHNSTKIFKVEDGTVVNVPGDADTSQYGSQYWKYLNTPLSSVDFSDLLKENKDTVGWIIVNNTNINYPVVQSGDNDFYLNHAYDKSSNNAGWIYADFRDNFNNFNSNLVIYGHGRKDKIMFGSLTNVLNKNWYTQEENQIIQLSTLKYNTMWQIFSIYTIEAENYYITTEFETNGEYSKFLNDMVSRSIYNFGINLSTDDKILTLSTCYNDNGIRLVVQAKLVKFQER